MKTLLAVILVSTALFAQDTRRVIEPAIPSACATLEAGAYRHCRPPPGNRRGKTGYRAHTGIAGWMPSRSCGGTPVQRRTQRIFSGPLELRPGVTLALDEGTILFASRDPRLYDRTPGGWHSQARPGSTDRVVFER